MSMYSLEERLLAVKTYYEIGRSARATVRRLGYPDESNLYHWVAIDISMHSQDRQ